MEWRNCYWGMRAPPKVHLSDPLLIHLAFTVLAGRANRKEPNYLLFADDPSIMSRRACLKLSRG